MTATETIKWIAVPNGIDQNGGNPQLLLSVFAGPELEGGATGTLADFPDFQNWPATVSSGRLSFLLTVIYGNNSTVTYDVPIPTGALKPTLWTNLFSAGTAYAPRSELTAANPNLAAVSYPAGTVGGFITSQYSGLSPTVLPTQADMVGVFGEIATTLVGSVGVDTRAQLARARLTPGKNGKVPYALDLASMSSGEAFALHSAYYQPAAGLLAQPGFDPQPDEFHATLTFIGEHGALQRALGLVFDLAIPLGSLNLPGGGPLFTGAIEEYAVSVGLQGYTPAVSYVPVIPLTICNASTSVFEPYSDDSQPGLSVKGGQLAVADATTFDHSVIDFSGGGLRAAAFATALMTRTAPVSAPGGRRAQSVCLPSSTADEPLPPPAVDTKGLTLLLQNPEQLLQGVVSRQYDLLQAPSDKPSPLYASDLTRGYILDVYDTVPANWFSTNARQITYSSPPGAPTVTLGPVTEEAATSAPPAYQNSPQDPDQQQYNTSPTILTYKGWSNAAPPPGTVVPDADSQANGEANALASLIAMDVGIPSHSLPKLRFGRTYYLRARVVDIACNVLPLGAGAPIGDGENRVIGPIPFPRHDVIGSPDVYAQNGSASYPIKAEGLRRLVIRDVDGPATSLRILAPPRCTPQFAERHGMFDLGGADGGLNPAAYSVFVPRESGQYPAPPSTQAEPWPSTIDPTQPVPYLPDPLARGGVLTLASGSQFSSAPVAFDFSPAGNGTWPDYRPYGYKLAVAGAGGRGVDIDANGRVITFALEPGDILNLTLACTCEQSDVSQFGLGSLLSGVDAATIAAGQAWAVTAFGQLELIYTCQKPQATPEFPSIVATRTPGATFAMLSGEITWSPRSTSKIDVTASWSDPVDQPATGYIEDAVDPGAAAHAARRRPLKALPPGPPVPSGVLMGPGAPNTNQQSASNVPVFTGPPAFETADCEVEGANTPIEGFASRGTSEYSVTDAFTNGRHEFHDTKHREVTYAATATTSFAEFYPEISDPADLGVKTVKPVLVSIPSSARPGSLSIPYVVPIYDWNPAAVSSAERAAAARATAARAVGRPPILSGRGPSALRVFIERPWWSSGIGELLGVLTWVNADQGQAISSPLDLYMSDWGLDPIFAGGALPTPHPTLQAFTNAATPHKATRANPAAPHNLNLTLEETSLAKVDVAGHQVSYDVARDLWYADVAIDFGSAYTPMVRLALARYQPASIAGVELGRVTLADVVPLEPGRTASVTTQPSGGRLKVSVALSGYSYSKAAGVKKLRGGVAVAPGVAQVLVEQRASDIADPDLGWEALGSPITMRARTHAGLTTWEATDVMVPSGGEYRLYINQYEVLPTDERPNPSANPKSDLPGYRLLFQDMIPLGKR